MNFTIDTAFMGNCITMQQCNSTIYERAVSECSKVRVEFVWFFIIGFMFSNIGYLILDSRINLNPLTKTYIINGCKISGYVLQCLGLLFFILGGYV